MVENLRSKAIITDGSGCEETDRVIGHVTLGKEWLDDVVGKREPHNSVRCRPGLETT